MPYWDKLELRLQNIQEEFKHAKELTDETYAEYRAKLAECARYKTALEKIEKLGHSHGHGLGYTCANIAQEALNVPCRHHWVSLDGGPVDYNIPTANQIRFVPLKARCNKCGARYDKV